MSSETMTVAVDVDTGDAKERLAAMAEDAERLRDAMAPSPGKHTSEFKLAAVVAVGCFILAGVLGGIQVWQGNDPNATITPLLVLLGDVLGYIAGRTKVKTAGAG